MFLSVQNTRSRIVYNGGKHECSFTLHHFTFRIPRGSARARRNSSSVSSVSFTVRLLSRYLLIAADESKDDNDAITMHLRGFHCQTFLLIFLKIYFLSTFFFVVQYSVKQLQLYYQRSIAIIQIFFFLHNKIIENYLAYAYMCCTYAEWFNFEPMKN